MMAVHFSWESDSEATPYLKPLGTEMENFPGVYCGFAGKEISDDNGENRAPTYKALLEDLHCDRICTLMQVHGTDLIVPSIERIQKTEAEFGSPIRSDIPADGWCIPIEEFHRSGILFGLSTADCLPIVMVSARYFLLIHAGWRGIRDGIIQEGLNLIQQNDGGTLRGVWIGPAADPARYEVGAEFTEYFDQNTLTAKGAAGDGEEKYLFDLYEAARGAFRGEGIDLGLFHSSPLYTISDERFFSYRADPNNPGRNLSFVAFPKKPFD